MITLPSSVKTRFMPEELLAEGGFGAVWRATQVGLSRPVALKLIHPRLLTDDVQVKRFLHEAEITAAIAHPNIVVLIDHGVDDGVPWIAYEYLPGESLRRRLARGPLPWREACRIADEVAAALEAAHAHGVLHRDIKPDNILHFQGDRYKVADFGIAKWSDRFETLTEQGVILGTPAYLSPVQIRGEVPGPESDLYALGATLHELITGSPPFEGPTPADVMRKHLMATPAPLSTRVDGIPPGLDLLVGRLLSKTRESRYPDATALRQGLRELLEAPIGSEPSKTLAGEKAPGQLSRGVAFPDTVAIQVPDALPVPAPGRFRAAMLGLVPLALLALVVASVSRRPVAVSPGSPAVTPSGPGAPAASAGRASADRVRVQGYLARREQELRPRLAEDLGFVAQEALSAVKTAALMDPAGAPPLPRWIEDRALDQVDLLAGMRSPTRPSSWVGGDPYGRLFQSLDQVDHLVDSLHRAPLRARSHLRLYVTLRDLIGQDQVFMVSVVEKVHKRMDLWARNHPRCFLPNALRAKVGRAWKQPWTELKYMVRTLDLFEAEFMGPVDVMSPDTFWLWAVLVEEQVSRYQEGCLWAALGPILLRYYDLCARRKLADRTDLQVYRKTVEDRLVPFIQGFKLAERQTYLRSLTWGHTARLIGELLDDPKKDDSDRKRATAALCYGYAIHRPLERVAIPRQALDMTVEFYRKWGQELKVKLDRQGEGLRDETQRERLRSELQRYFEGIEIVGWTFFHDPTTPPQGEEMIRIIRELAASPVLQAIYPPVDAAAIIAGWKGS